MPVPTYVHPWTLTVSHNRPIELPTVYPPQSDNAACKMNTA
jgi:hypothetical protein